MQLQYEASRGAAEADAEATRAAAADPKRLSFGLSSNLSFGSELADAKRQAREAHVAVILARKVF